MRLRWTLPAAEDLKDIKEYLANITRTLQSPRYGRFTSASAP